MMSTDRDKKEMIFKVVDASDGPFGRAKGKSVPPQSGHLSIHVGGQYRA